MMNSRKIMIAGLAISGILLCAMNSKTIPDGAVAVKPFSTDKYLGTWYEIARLDYKFEKNLDNVTATYSLRDDGMIKVDNRGYNFKKEKWEQSIGKAKPVSDPKEGKLKVSFFGPFYAGYNVIAIDTNYMYALVVGKNTDYMWLLSREKTMPENIKNDYVEKAKQIGFDTGKLIWVKHDREQKIAM